MVTSNKSVTAPEQRPKARVEFQETQAPQGPIASLLSVPPGRKNRRKGAMKTALLGTLEFDRPLRPSEISKRLSVPVKIIDVSLARLKRQGLAKTLGQGQWVKCSTAGGVTPNLAN